MCPDHHDFVTDLGIHTGDLHDEVVGLDVVLLVGARHLDGQRHGDVLLQKAGHEVVVLPGEDHGRNRPRTLISTRHEQRAVFPPRGREHDPG